MRIPAGGDGDVMRGGGGGGGGGGGASTTSWPTPGPTVPKAEALMLFIRHEEHPGVPVGISRELVGDILLAGRWVPSCMFNRTINVRIISILFCAFFIWLVMCMFRAHLYCTCMHVMFVSA